MFVTGTCVDCGEEVSAIFPGEPSKWCARCGEVSRLRAEVEAQRRDLKNRCEELESASKLVERLTRDAIEAQRQVQNLCDERCAAEARVAELEGWGRAALDCCVCPRCADSIFTPPAPADHLTGVGKMVAEEFECPRGHGPMTGFNPEFGTPACSSCGAEPAKCGTCGGTRWVDGWNDTKSRCTDCYGKD